MGILPNTRLARVEFFEAHDPVWAATAGGAGVGTIGLTSAQITAQTTKATDARTKYNAMIAAREAAKSATLAFYNSEDAMTLNGAGLISVIKAFAESTANPNVYVLAQIPPPSQRQPYGPPTNPTNVGAFLENDGSVTLSWKGTLFGGQFYSIWRQLFGSTDWIQVGTVAAKKFNDALVPSGIVSASYQVRGQRGSLSSPGSEPVTVLFGSQQQQQAA